MDYADLREGIFNHLCSNVPSVGNRVFWGWTAPADTVKPFLEMSFIGELPQVNNPCGLWMQVEVLVVGEESDILSLDPIADLVVTVMHNQQVATPLLRIIKPRYIRDSRIDFWDENLRANIIRLKFLIPTDFWT